MLFPNCILPQEADERFGLQSERREFSRRFLCGIVTILKIVTAIY
jgi:hypothetical protein